MSMKSRDARTEPSLREYVQDCFDRESDSLAESKNRDITSGAMVAYQNVLAELARREAVPPVTTFATDVANERQRQDEKWGVQRHSWGNWMLILTEEIGEISQAVLRVVFPSSSDISLKEDMERMRIELIQSAAVIAAIIEHVDETLVAVESAAKGGV